MSLWSRIERRLEELAGEILPDEHRERVEQARAALDEGDAEAAAELLAAVVTARPEDTTALSLLGGAQLALGRPADALSSFDAALAIDDDLPLAAIGRGEALRALGQPSEAATAYRAAVDRAGGDKTVLAAAYRGLGLAYLAQDETGKAVRELRKAVAEDADDVDSLTALGQALLASPDHSVTEARRFLGRATDRPGATADAWRALGAAELALGNLAAADQAFAELDDDPAALTGRGDVALARGDLAAAHEHYLRALEHDARSAELHGRIGDVHRASGDLVAARASYDRAIRLGADLDIVRRSLDIALATGSADDRAIDLANRVLAADAGDPRALTARGLRLLHDGQLDAARATFAAALGRGDDVEAQLAMAALHLAFDEPAGAADAAWAALRLEPHGVRARALLGTARARQFAVADVGEPYPLALDLQRLALARADLADMVAEVAQAAADFDQPLLVTVMGEFSSGKSTFINAFVEEDIAPVGITPTTATINVLKYGRERAGRIVYADGRVIDLPWSAFSVTLRELDAESAREVASVEILYPLDVLERVNIVDTPGLNSILPEHEAVARNYIGRADAVVWLFAAGQAGKQTEREALDAIRAEGKRVLGVLNKVDQLSEQETQELIGYLRGELGDRVEVLVPLSARAARGSRDDGNWPALTHALEERFFSRARELKRQACDRRLAALVARARARVQDRRARAAAAASALTEAAATARAAVERFADHDVADVRRGLRERTAALYRGAAREVLALVRPRKLPFGSHRASPADRDYLIGLLDAGFSQLLEPARRQVSELLHAAGNEAAAAAAREAAVIGAEPAALLEVMARESARLVEARVFDRADAFVRGYLRGGVVDRFFRHALPKLELTEDAAYHALYRDSPDLDAEIARPLADAAREGLTALADQLDHLAGLAGASAYDLECGVERALDHIDARRRGMTLP